VVPGPLAGDTIWYEDPVRKNKHRELVRAGMERARQEGRRIGRPKVTEREGFRQRFAAVVHRLGEGTLSRRQAAKDLGIGYATLKRLMDARLAALQQGGIGPEEPEKTPSFAPVEDRLVSPYDPDRSEGVRAAESCTDYVASIGGVTFSPKP